MKAAPVILGILAVATLALGQKKQTTVWKEYSYPQDGFAITSPSAPDVHPSPAVPDALAYIVSLPGTEDHVALRVTQHPRDCQPVIATMRQKIISGEARNTIPSTTLQEISTNGSAGLQYEWKVNDEHRVLERWYCANDHLYIFGVGHAAGKPISKDMTRILDSFRILSTDSH